MRFYLVQRVQRQCLRSNRNVLSSQSLPEISKETLRTRCFSTATAPESFSSQGPVTATLDQLIQKEEIHSDPHQRYAAEELDRIYHELMENEPPSPAKIQSTSNTTTSSSSSSSMFGGFFGGSSPVEPVKRILSPTRSIPGAYMYGGVGCGKTFLMNMLYDAVDSGPWSQQKQKVHYHKFMLNVHQHMHQARKKDPHGDLIAPVVDLVLQEGRFLCLDEFQVTDVADALILQRLFEGLWQQGCVLVATSNRPPRDLYLNGLQRDRFIPFIDLLEQKCAQVDLMESSTDYRLLLSFAKGEHSIYFNKDEKRHFDDLFSRFTDGHSIESTNLITQGRKVPIPASCASKKVASFSFDDLCRTAMGAADYLTIGQNYRTVFCHGIPKLTIDHVNWLRRFITFVDSMYELKVKLILHTEDASNIDGIFIIEDDKENYSQDEVFAFDRTRSRLEEMAGEKYLSSQWLGGKE